MSQLQLMKPCARIMNRIIINALNVTGAAMSMTWRAGGQSLWRQLLCWALISPQQLSQWVESNDFSSLRFGSSSCWLCLLEWMRLECDRMLCFHDVDTGAVGVWWMCRLTPDPLSSHQMTNQTIWFSRMMTSFKTPKDVDALLGCRFSLRSITLILWFWEAISMQNNGR